MHTKCYKYSMSYISDLGSELRAFGKELTDNEKEIILEQINKIIVYLQPETVAVNQELP